MKIVGKDKNLASFKIVGYLGGTAPQPFREAPIAVTAVKNICREGGGSLFIRSTLPPLIFLYIDTLVTGLEAPTNDTACSNGIYIGTVCTPSVDEL